MTRNDKKILRVLAGETINPPPLWLMRQAGRYLPEYRELRKKSKSFLNFCYSPELAVEATLQPLRRYALDAGILFCDILVIPDALGQDVDFVTGEGPRLEPIRSKQELADLSIDGLHDHLAPVYEVIRQLRKEMPASAALIGFAGAPWTLACYMVEGQGTRDFVQPRLWGYTDPETFAQLIAILVESVSGFLSTQIENGVEVVQLFDSWAGVLSPSAFRQWVIKPTREIVRRLKDKHPEVPIIGFPRGAGGLYKEYASETGVDAVSVDSTVPAAWIGENLQPQTVVQGNLDNIALLSGGTALREEAETILNALYHGPHIFNLGHGVLQMTPPEHVEELLAIVASGGN